VVMEYTVYTFTTCVWGLAIIPFHNLLLPTLVDLLDSVFDTANFNIAMATTVD